MKSRAEITEISNRMLDFFACYLQKPLTDLPDVREFSEYLAYYYAMEDLRAKSIDAADEQSSRPDNLKFLSENESLDADDAFFTTQNEFAAYEMRIRNRILKGTENVGGGTELPVGTYNLIFDVARRSAEDRGEQLRTEFGIRSWLEVNGETDVHSAIEKRSGALDDMLLNAGKLPEALYFKNYLLAVTNSHNKIEDRLAKIQSEILNNRFYNRSLVVPDNPGSFATLLERCAQTVRADIIASSNPRHRTALANGFSLS